MYVVYDQSHSYLTQCCPKFILYMHIILRHGTMVLSSSLNHKHFQNEYFVDWDCAIEKLETFTTHATMLAVYLSGKLTYCYPYFKICIDMSNSIKTLNKQMHLCVCINVLFVEYVQKNSKGWGISSFNSSPCRAA